MHWFCDRCGDCMEKWEALDGLCPWCDEDLLECEVCE